MLNVVAVSPTGAHGPRPADHPVRLRAGHQAPRRDRSGPTTTTVPATTHIPTSASFHPGAYDIEEFQVYDVGHRCDVPAQDTRPVADVRQRRWARSWWTSTCTYRAPRRHRLRRQRDDCVAQLLDRADLRLEPADPGPGLRSALRGRHWRDPWHGGDQGNAISRFITFSVPKATLGTPGPGMGIHRRADRTGRLQHRPGAQLRCDAAGFRSSASARGQQRRSLHGDPAQCRS